MVGTVAWSLGNLTTTLSYKMFEDSDRLVVSGIVQPNVEVSLSDVWVELVYSPRVTEVKRIDDYTWDIRCDDSIYGTIGIAVYDPEGVAGIEDTGRSLRLYMLKNPSDRTYSPQEVWAYSFYLFPHTGYKVEGKEDIPPLHRMPVEHYRRYYKTLVGYETIDEVGIEPNWNVFVYYAAIEPGPGKVAELRMYAEEGTYPVRFFFEDRDIEAIRKGGLFLPEDQWSYDRESGVLAIDSHWDGPTLLEIFSIGRADSNSAFSTPLDFHLSQNLPNPFMDTTVIPLRVPDQSRVRIRIYDVTGRLVKELLNGDLISGGGELIWDGRGFDGEKVASGVYFLRMEVVDREFTEVRKLVLIR